MTKAKDRLAVEECLILWKYLAQSGSTDKKGAIRKLHEQKRLSREYYFNNCPFCEQFNCGKCPWRTVPNHIGGCTVCMHDGSHYRLWTAIIWIDNRRAQQRAASAVYKFLKQIKIEEI